MEPVQATAYARAGLLGNPSDGYGGKAIALSISDFRARVQLTPCERFELVPGPSDGMAFETLHEANEHFGAAGCDDGLRLLRAAARRFVLQAPDVAALDADDPLLRFRVHYETDIPRQVGLAGSSAIVVAALRALCVWFGTQIPPARLAELALAAELEELGIAAGAMDRVIQSHGGLMCMDLAEPRSPASYRALDPTLLPPLFVAWDLRGGTSSGGPHGTLRARWLAGDPEVLGVIEAFRALVDEGVGCLEAGDHDHFRELLRRNFEMRTRIFDVSEPDRTMIAVADAAGAAAKLCGSGGAIVGMPPAGQAEAGLRELARRYRDAGFGFLRPTPGPVMS